MKRAALSLIFLLVADQASAIKNPVKTTRRDARRGVRMTGASADPGQAIRAWSSAPSADAARKFGDFNKANGGGWKIRFNPRTGAPEALVEGEARPRTFAPMGAAGAGSPPESPENRAAAFLAENLPLLKIDPAQLEIEKVNAVGGHANVLYRQVYRGLPVENSRVKVHLGPGGTVIGAHSRYDPTLDLDPAPAVSEQAAADAVLRDGGIAPSGGTLVIFPNEDTGRAHLAWKFTARGRYALWRYYVDARTGDVLFRYNDMRYQCNTTGTIQGQVYDIDPSQSVLAARPMGYQNVYVGLNAVTPAVTNNAGLYCHADTGKIVTSLQGPYVRVSNFRGRNVHYDNGSGVWATQATPLSSAHPYGNGVNVISTVDLSVAQPNAVKILPVFSAFNVGGFDDGIDIVDNDQVAVLDLAGKPVANYVGNRGPFNAAAVHGRKYSLQLRSNQSGQQYGYDVAVSSYLTLTAPGVVGAPNLTWTAGMTETSGSAQISLFYHLNKMRDYFLGGPNKSSAAFISEPVVASAYFGPNFGGAFYDPEYDNLSFGDVSDSSPQDALADDATVPRHEYSHFVMERLFPLQNYGQAGAISEALADYFAASSLNYPSIGFYFSQSQGGTGPLRELDCVVNPEPCWKLNGLGPNGRPWFAEIHDDSIFLSQALWDIRRNRIAALGAGPGQKCADGLAFQALLFFPESFAEFYDAIKRANNAQLVLECGAPAGAATIINTAFSDHGMIPPIADALEGSRNNDGFETAVDITTYTSISATIAPASDLDFYSFSPGVGPAQLTLHLPADGNFFKAYSIFLFDRQRRLVAEAHPAYDGFDTFAGLCESHNCTTTNSSVVLTYTVTSSSAGLHYVQIGGGYTGFSNSGVNSASPYTFEASYTRAGALAGSIVSAKVDQDVISFAVNVTSFTRFQNYGFAHAQLRDHAAAILPGTDTRSAASFLTWLSSHNALGRITGTVRLAAGFSARYPSIGTVHLEVFGYNIDPDGVRVSTVSLGMSNPLNLTTDRSEVKAFNNVFTPSQGGKTTIKFDVTSPGRLTLRLYTLSGQLVSTVFDGDVTAGKGAVDWAGRNLGGSVVASGVYVLHALGPGLDKRQKIVVVK